MLSCSLDLADRGLEPAGVCLQHGVHRASLRAPLRPSRGSRVSLLRAPYVDVRTAPVTPLLLGDRRLRRRSRLRLPRGLLQRQRTMHTVRGWLLTLRSDIDVFIDTDGLRVSQQEKERIVEVLRTSDGFHQSHAQ